VKGGVVRIPFVVAAIVVAAHAAAADRPCGKGDAAQASKALDRVNTWSQLRKGWHDWAHCDTGPTADLFTDAVLRLAVDWKDVGTLAAGMRDDRGYHDFILAHVKGAAKEDRDVVYSRAKASCPAGDDAVCGEIAAAAKGEGAKPREPDTLDLSPIGRTPEPPARK
jgi:hypothetical protein